MELQTIDMDRTAAREKVAEYLRSVRERHTDEDKAILDGYRALAKGTPVIRLSEVIHRGDTRTLNFRRGRTPYEAEVPNLAIARADAEWVWTWGITDRGEVVMQTKRRPAPNNRRDVVLVGGFTEDLYSAPWFFEPVVRAMVPHVPPALRPKDKLGNYHVLFEAEWGVDPEPPVDPALLKRIGGDLYAVCAVWDLTELERAVLAGRP